MQNIHESKNAKYLEKRNKHNMSAKAKEGSDEDNQLDSVCQNCFTMLHWLSV